MSWSKACLDFSLLSSRSRRETRHMMALPCPASPFLVHRTNRIRFVYALHSSVSLQCDCHCFMVLLLDAMHLLSLRSQIEIKHVSNKWFFITCLCMFWYIACIRSVQVSVSMTHLLTLLTSTYQCLCVRRFRTVIQNRNYLCAPEREIWWYWKLSGVPGRMVCNSAIAWSSI